MICPTSGSRPQPGSYDLSNFSGGRSTKANHAAAPADATGPKPTVAQLPLPTGAREVVYKALVQQIAFTVEAPVSQVVKEFAAQLEAQGWTPVPGSLTGPTNAILKRRLQGAELTAMLQPQPSGSGCTVKVFTQGLDWSNPPAATSTSAPAPASSTPTVNPDNLEAEAQRRLQEALQGLPGVK